MPGTDSLYDLQLLKVCMCVFEPRKVESSRFQGENVLESLEVTDLPEESNPDTPHPGPRAEIDGLHFKQGLNIGLPSLCVEGDRENATPLTQVHSPDLFCSS